MRRLTYSLLAINSGHVLEGEDEEDCKHIDVQYNGKEYHFDEHPPIKKDQKLCNVTVEKFYATAVVPEQKYDNGT
ncbi:hypothetical protein OSTOST_16077, partial [Ostertagia ostertagi]